MDCWRVLSPKLGRGKMVVALELPIYTGATVGELEQINQSILKFREDEPYAEIYLKWFGENP